MSEATDEINLEFHEPAGEGNETRCYCSLEEEVYGPHEDATSELPFCPYCGEKSHHRDHEQDVEAGDVLCENTSRSSYHFCPGCGQNISKRHDPAGQGP